MSNQDCRDLLMSDDEIRDLLRKEVPDSNLLKQTYKIAVRAATNLKLITQFALKIYKQNESKYNISRWPVFHRLLRRLSFTHKVHQIFVWNFTQDTNRIKLKKILAEWHQELKGLKKLSNHNADEQRIPRASELELLIELCYKTFGSQVKSIGELKTFLQDLADKLGELDSQPTEGTLSQTDKTAGLPRVLFFCVSHEQGLLCAASQPSYVLFSPLARIFRKIRKLRFRRSVLDEIKKKDEERKEKKESFRAFDHKNEVGEAFVLKPGTPLVFETCLPCVKCKALYEYEWSNIHRDHTRSYHPGSCAEDLCHDYCTREPMEGIVQDPMRSFF